MATFTSTVKRKIKTSVWNKGRYFGLVFCTFPKLSWTCGWFLDLHMWKLQFPILLIPVYVIYREKNITAKALDFAGLQACSGREISLCFTALRIHTSFAGVKKLVVCSQVSLITLSISPAGWEVVTWFWAEPGKGVWGSSARQLFLNRGNFVAFLVWGLVVCLVFFSPLPLLLKYLCVT